MKAPLLTQPPESTPSYIAIAGHPIHPMLITFPVAYLMAALASDLGYWWTSDPFWARASLWLTGGGLAMGLLAALAGTLDFLLVKEIRRHVTSWSHFLMAVMMLSMAGANWWLRLPDPEAGVMPWGIVLSAATAFALSIAGWLGGKLVFEHKVGTGEDEEAEDEVETEVVVLER